MAMSKAENRFLVSAIIPVYNGQRFLGEAIESVLNQTYGSIELIVVDDGSTDNTASIAKKFGPSVKYYYQSNRGTAAALNQGIDLAAGGFLAFLGADDHWTKDKTELQMAAFASNDKLDIVSGYVKQFFSPELNSSERSRIQYSKKLMPGQVIPAMLIKRSVFSHVGLFEIQWQVGAEMSWYLRAMELGVKMIVMPDLVLFRRIHKNNKGITKRHLIKQRVHILKASLERRRNAELDKNEDIHEVRQKKAHANGTE
jgi:glycosyltransferase involved in cell wall biosynthesis